MAPFSYILATVLSLPLQSQSFLAHRAVGNFASHRHSFRGETLGAIKKPSRFRTTAMHSDLDGQDHEESSAERNRDELIKALENIYLQDEARNNDEEDKDESYNEVLRTVEEIKEMSVEETAAIVLKMYTTEHEPTELNPRADYDYDLFMSDDDEKSHNAIYRHTVTEINNNWSRLSPSDQESLQSDYDAWQLANFLLGDYYENGDEEAPELYNAMALARPLRVAIHKILNPKEDE